MPDRSGDLRVISIVFLVFVCLTMALRCYVRRWVVHAFGWDDGLMILAVAIYITCSGCLIAGTHKGFGRKFVDLTMHQNVVAMKYWWITLFFYGLATNICKLSVCLFLMRITIRPLHTRILYTMLIYITIHTVINFTMNLVRCRPVAYSWTQLYLDPNISGTCISLEVDRAMAFALTASLGFIDMILGIVVPILIVYKLQIPKANKFAVVGILSVACLATIAGFIRIPYMEFAYYSSEPIYDTVNLIIWAWIELSLSIAAGNIATLGPLLRTWFGVLSHRDNTPTAHTTPRQSRRGRPRGVRDLSFPLSTLDGTGHSRFRPDKLCVTVSQVQSQHRREADNSQDGLTSTQPGTSAGSYGDLDLGLGIYRTIEVAQTSDVESAIVEERV